VKACRFFYNQEVLKGKQRITVYDNEFRTILNDCSRLIIPVVNEMFGEPYTGRKLWRAGVRNIMLSVCPTPSIPFFHPKMRNYPPDPASGCSIHLLGSVMHTREAFLTAK